MPCFVNKMAFRKEHQSIFLWPFFVAVSFLKCCEMVAAWKNNYLASLNAQMSDEERHSAHDKSRYEEVAQNQGVLWGIFAVCSRLNNTAMAELSWLHGD